MAVKKLEDSLGKEVGCVEVGENLASVDDGDAGVQTSDLGQTSLTEDLGELKTVLRLLGVL